MVLSINFLNAGCPEVLQEQKIGVQWPVYSVKECLKAIKKPLFSHNEKINLNYFQNETGSKMN